MILMKRIPLNMVRQDLFNIPEYSLPTGFRMRFFEKGDEQKWAKVETSVDEFKNKKDALEHFNQEFGAYIEEMSKRCIFIENKNGEVIGTTTAWYGDLNEDGDLWGRIHWVAISPEYQGRGLSKPLLSAAMSIIAGFHSKAYLTSQTTSYQAVNMYLSYGFEPYIINSSCYEAWDLLESTLNRKILA